MPRLKVLAFLGVALPALATAVIAAQTDAPKAPKTAVAVKVIAKGLENPWGLQFLPDGRALVTERPGRMRVVGMDGKVSEPLSGLPNVVHGGQAGLLDVLLAPDFSQSGIVYFSYSEPRGDSENGTSVVRAKLTLNDKGGAISDGLVIFRQEPAYEGVHHFGSRLVWAKDGTLFITTGERGDKEPVSQDLSHHLGKVIRLNADGAIPKDNPFVGQDGKLPDVWSYGHRNIQGAAINPATGELWTTEHGAQGGDELNITRAGKNYGWPIITWGEDYGGGKIGEGTSKPGLEQPIYYWVPSIGTSGLAFYTGDLFPNWKGSVLVGGLSGSVLERLVLDGEQVVGVERLLTDLEERVRDVRIGPDGAVYVLTDSGNGKLLRIAPAN